MVSTMNIETDIRRTSTGRETGTFPAFLRFTLLDPSSVSDPTTEGAPYSAKLERPRSDTSDPRTQYILRAGAKIALLNMRSLECVSFRLIEHGYMYELRLLDEDTSSAITQAAGYTQNKASNGKIADESKKALEALTVLADNWNGNGGRAPTAEAISAAKALVERLAPHLKEIPFFYPAAKGGIVAEVSAGVDRLTIILESDFLLGVSFVAGGHEMKEFDTTQGLTDKAVAWVNSRLAALNRQRVSA
jgi:hypothetical protein